jgi:GT2 family glycosyltransferase
MNEGHHDLDIVIVSFNCQNLVQACLSSLERHPLRRGRMRVHLVDNASADATVEVVRARFPDVRVWPLRENAGFSAANNLVLRSTHAPYALLLNPDTEALEGTLDHMLDLMRARPDIGLAGCRLVLLDGSFDHAAKRSFPTPLSALAHFTGFGRRSSHAALAGYRAPDLPERGAGPTDAINGAFMVVRRSAMEQVGLLDEGYWLYMEDLDWCHRFWGRGWVVFYDGEASFIHVKGGTSGRHRATKQNLAFHRGMGRFYRRFYADDQPVAAPFVYVGIGVKLAVSLLRNARARRAL